MFNTADGYPVVTLAFFPFVHLLPLVNAALLDATPDMKRLHTLLVVALYTSAMGVLAQVTRHLEQLLGYCAFGLGVVVSNVDFALNPCLLRLEPDFVLVVDACYVEPILDSVARCSYKSPVCGWTQLALNWRSQVSCCAPLAEPVARWDGVDIVALRVDGQVTPVTVEKLILAEVVQAHVAAL